MKYLLRVWHTLWLRYHEREGDIMWKAYAVHSYNAQEHYKRLKELK